MFGCLIARAVESLDRTVVLLASGGLSHRFWPLREIRLEAATLEEFFVQVTASQAMAKGEQD